MKRRLSILLALVLCLSLLPMTTLAAGDTLKDIPLPKPMRKLKIRAMTIMISMARQ